MFFVTMYLLYRMKASNCYGCASAAVEHCITLLRALVTNSDMRQMLCSQVIGSVLAEYSVIELHNEKRKSKLFKIKFSFQGRSFW